MSRIAQIMYPRQASQDWFDDTWERRKQITLGGSTSGAVEDYPVLLVIDFEIEMNVDFSDLRFTSTDNTTLDFWIESTRPLHSVSVWVKVPAIAAHPATGDIYMYYGNPQASAASDCAATFLCGTDFTKDDGFSFRDNGSDEAFGSQTGALRSGLKTFNIGEYWRERVHHNNTRFDTIAGFNDRVLLTGSRQTGAGYLYKSVNHGITWENKGNLFSSRNVTAITTTNEDVGYVLTGDSYLYKTADQGESWTNLGQISSNPSFSGSYQRSYGLITIGNIVLVTDTRAGGGHIFRSEDGGSSWTDLGQHTGSPLYVFEKVEDGMLLSGWSGKIFKSYDDGLTWTEKATLSSGVALYRMCHLGNGIVLVVGDARKIFRSTNNGETWTDLGTFGTGQGDTVASLQGGVVIYSSYNGSHDMYRSTDYGATWANLSLFRQTAAGDYIDAGLSVMTQKGIPIGVAATNLGYVATSHSESFGLLEKVSIGRVSDSYVRKQLPQPLVDGFAIRTRVAVRAVSHNSNWVSLIGISTTGQRMGTIGVSSLEIMQRGNFGIGLVEFQGTAYTTPDEVVTSLGQVYTIELCRPAASSNAITRIYDQQGNLVGARTVAVGSHTYNYLMAQNGVPASGWAASTSSQDMEYVLCRKYVDSEPAMLSISDPQGR